MTGRPRRKAGAIDFDLLEYAAILNEPIQVALTFCGHYDPTMRSGRNSDAVSTRVRRLIEQVESATGAPVTLLDTGPQLDDIIELVPAAG